MQKNESPLVSISMLTYNHEKYIQQAIESVLMQRVNFPYQLVVGEDASTDKTREIVLSYVERFPERFSLVFHDRNVGMEKNVLSVRPFLTGKYIACLEGDDYWTDPDKLQRQVDFLETHPEYIGTSHDVLDVDENGEDYPQSSSYFKGRVYTLKQVEQYLLAGHTSTLLYHRFHPMLGEQGMEIYNRYNIVGDRKLNLVLAALGDVYHLDGCMSAHRHPNTSWTQQKRPGGMSFHDYQTMGQLQQFAKELFGQDLVFGDVRWRAWFGTVAEYVRHPDPGNWEAVKTAWTAGNDQIEKVLYLIKHTATWPYRAVYRRRKERF